MYLNSIIIYYKKTPCAPGHEWRTKKKKKKFQNKKSIMIIIIILYIL